MTGVRVMTWNLWWRFGDWERREEALIRVMRQETPDLVGLQEVWGTQDDDQARRLAERLGLQCVWAPSPVPDHFQRRIGDPTIGVGNAIFSRWPIVSHVRCSLPGNDRDAGRTALLAAVDTPNGAIAFVTTQLTSTVGNSAVRCEQVRALARFVVDGAPASASLVLTGDLNAEPDSDEVRLLGGHKTAPAAPGLVLLDAWRYADSDARQWTWDRRNPAVRATGEPSARIDYVFLGYRASTEPTLRIRAARLAGDGPVNGVWPSDHAAVIVDLSWTGRSRDDTLDPGASV
jgi:endonuclease/exonuclease/phosphatase family metal-dependent hydrolase